MQKLFDAFQKEVVYHYLFQCVHSNDTKYRTFKKYIFLELFLRNDVEFSFIHFLQHVLCSDSPYSTTILELIRYYSI